jgi:hypothetical protein
MYIINSFLPLPSGIPTLEWKIFHLWIIFPIKLPFKGDFPASHVRLPEGMMKFSQT